jgi:predicted transcriptional regulator
MPDTSATTLELDPEIKARLERLAKARQRPTVGLLLEAIEQYVDREERRGRFHEDALAALAAYERDGLHLTGEEADAWLARLEAGEDVEPPQPHT